MQKSNVSWQLFAVLGAFGIAGALFAPGCTVTTDDDDVDVDAGSSGGSAGSSSSGGSAGSSGGSAGSSSSGGSAGSSGSGGTGGDSGGTAGTGGSGGSGPMMACGDAVVLPQPNCDADPADDECQACLKSKCCEEWKACFASDTTAGDHVCGWGDWGGEIDNGEIGCIIACMAAGGTDTAECAGQCLASSWENSTCTDGTITVETSDLVGCMDDPEDGCQAECFAE